ncbi:DUF3466 family protein [Shewanella sp. SR44-3]|uniref:DUF3466 family protein n=1 Tax=Shewanella sp. SR44-3 TaxID=2760936 RepID=UPI0015FAF65A|nr:DUF3466 family protein [Shewanella sp. SR44-3]MBB1271097.1 DUF3466 family protein [Shewanella sp. SR44-3]
MTLKFDKALSIVALSVLGALSGAQAAPVYEIVNIENFDLKGTLTDTRNGYAMAVNATNELAGIAKGTKKLTVEDIQGGIIDVEDGIAPAAKIEYSIFKPIVANNFTFTAEENDATAPWNLHFLSISGSVEPSKQDATSINSVDSYFYDINDAGIKVGSYSGVEKKRTYVGDLTTQDFWYFRDFELRGVAVNNGVEVPLLPPYTTYVRAANAASNIAETTVELGGVSVAAAINSSNLVVGYASTALASFSADRINTCIDAALAAGAVNPTPIDICVQSQQYPINNTRNVQYQTRAYVWQLDATTATGTELPLGLTPPEGSTLVYTAQGLGVNTAGTVVGRSHVFRNDNQNLLYSDAAYWTRNDVGNYQYSWVKMADEVFNSIAYDINDSGLLVGSYSQYIQGYARNKFFYFDINNPEAGITTPDDFKVGLSDLSSKPKDINNKGQVVGHIETTFDKDKPRPKAGFLFDMNTKEFSNLNSLLTCDSQGYAKDASGNWLRNKINIADGSGAALSYETDIQVVEANSINEDGTIVGTAFIRKPQYQIDSAGNLILGTNGQPLFALDGNGNPVTSYLPRMVVLKPTTSGAICDLTTTVIEENYERKGAASFAWLFALPLLWLRRRSKK